MSASSHAHAPVGPFAARSLPTRRDVSARVAAAGVMALVAVASALRFYRIGHQGFWFDEANTALLVHFSPGRMVGLIPQSESTPPLYYCIAWVWARVFGFGEVGLRSLSAVAGVCVVPVAFAAMQLLSTRRAALILTALVATNPLLIWYSQEARSYELLVLLCALSLWAFAHMRAAPGRRSAALWALACAPALATHYFAVVAVAPQAVWLLVEHRGRREVRAAVAVVALCGLALIPLATSQNATRHDSWIHAIPFSARLGQLIPQFLIGTGAPDRTLLLRVAMAVAVIGVLACVLVPARSVPGVRGAPLRPGVLACSGLATGGFVLCLALAADGYDEIITRNLIVLWLPAAVVVAAGLAALRPRGLGVCVVMVLCAACIWATLGVAAQRDLQRPDWRYVARALGPPPAGGRIIVVQNYAYLLPLRLYMRGLHRLAGLARASQIDVIAIATPRPANPFCWWGAACNLHASGLQRRYAVAGFRPQRVRHVLQFSIRPLQAPHPVTLSRRTVAAALRSPRADTIIGQPG